MGVAAREPPSDGSQQLDSDESPDIVDVTRPSNELVRGGGETDFVGAIGGEPPKVDES